MMRFAHAVLICSTLLTLNPTGSGAAEFEMTADSREGEVEWWPPSGTPIEIDGARHGVAKIEGGAVSYVPTPGGDFWTVGSERLLVTVAQAGVPDSLHRLSILAGSPGDGPPTTHFETGEAPPVIHGLDSQVFLRPAGALLGEIGAHLVLDGSGAPAYVEYLFAEDATLGDPGNVNNGCVDLRMAIDSDGRDSLSACLGNGDEANCGAISLLKAETAAGVEVFRVEVGITPNSTQFRVVAFETGGLRETPWVTTSALPHAVRLDWWTGDSGGVRLRIDGRVRGELRDLDMPNLEVAEMQVGAPENPANSFHKLAVDAITVRSGAADSEVTPTTADAFETDLSAWHAVGQAAGAVSVSSTAALGGDAGLEIDLAPASGGWGAWVLDDVPDPLASMGLRFRLDVADLHMAAGETMNLALGQISDGATVASRFHIRLWHSPSGIKIRASVRNDLGAQLHLPYALLGAGGVDHHQVELEWRAASEPESDDGRLRLWLDGALIGELTGLDNDEVLVNSLRFGAMYLQSGTHGTLRLDEFESWR